jgi:hypothetical protein
MQCGTQDWIQEHKKEINGKIDKTQINFGV